MIKYSLIRILSGGARPRYNSHDRILLESVFIGLVLYNVFSHTTSQLISLTPIIIFLSVPLFRSRILSTREKKYEKEYLQPSAIETILIFSIPVLLGLGITLIYIIISSEYLFLGGYQSHILISSVVLNLMYWVIKLREGRKYGEYGGKFAPASDYTTLWEQASFSYEMGVKLADKEKFTSAYYHFLNSKARFDHIAAVENMGINSRDASNLSEASKIMGKYCRAVDRGDYHSAEAHLSEAKTILKIISSKSSYKTCYNCGKNITNSRSNRRNGEYICDECIRFGGGNFTRKTKREQETFNRRFYDSDTGASSDGQERVRNERSRYKVDEEEKQDKRQRKKRNNKDKNKKYNTNKNKRKRKKRKKKRNKNSKGKSNKNKSRKKSSKENKKSKSEKQKRKQNHRVNSQNGMSYEQALEVLGLKRPVTDEEIKEAYREKAKKHHPDTSETSDTEKIKEVNKAKERLLD